MKAVTINGNREGYSFYPNPVTDLLTITGEQLDNIKIMDNLGRVVNHKILFISENQNQKILDLSQLSSGSYFIHMNGYTKSVVKY